MITGILILIPLFVTYILIAFLFNLLGNAGTPIIRGLLSFLDLDQIGWLMPLVPFINLLIVLALIFFIGLIGTNIVGRRILCDGQPTGHASAAGAHRLRRRQAGGGDAPGSPGKLPTRWCCWNTPRREYG